MGNNKLKAAVLMGGIGEERKISLQSGKCVADALQEAGLDVTAADITPDNMEILDDGNIDVFFLALHGEFGEDGRLQQILEDKSLVYTGSGPKASRLAFDKMASKRAFVKAGVLTPPVVEFDAHSDIRKIEKQMQSFGGKYVVKPIRQGSSVGVSIVGAIDSAIKSARKCLDEFGDCMIEKFITGREVTVGILCGRTLPIIEIRAKTGFYDYQAKYIDDNTEYLFDTIKDPAVEDRVASAAMDCFNALDCRHFARVDFILTDDGNAHALEVNTIPGFTSHSLLPKAAAKIGLSMSDLCVKIIRTAMEDKKAAVSNI